MLHKNVSITRRFHIKRGWETVPSPPNRTASLKTPTVSAGLQRVASTSRSQTEGAPHPNGRQAGRAVLTAERLQPGSSAGTDAGGRCLWGPGVCGTQGGSTRMEMCCPNSRRRQCLRLTDAKEILGGRGALGTEKGGPRDRERASC